MNDPATLWLSGVALGAAISAFVIVAFEKESVKEQLARIEQRLARMDVNLSVVLETTSLLYGSCPVQEDAKHRARMEDSPSRA